MSTGPASASEAMEMVPRQGLGYLAGADATAMAAETQAQCLRMLEQATAMGTAARASVLAAFASGQGYWAEVGLQSAGVADEPDPHYQRRRHGVRRVGRPGPGHPEVTAALAAGEMSESFARTICQWTDKLPEACRPDADEILLAAAGTGMDLRDLCGLAGEIYARSLPGNPDDGKNETFGDRSVRLETTFDGAGYCMGT